MKKTWNIISNIFTWLIVALAVGMMIFTVISVNTFDQGDRDLFGIKMFTVLSDSMKKTDFDAGDVVFVKEVDPSTLEAGDIVAFQSQKEMNGKLQWVTVTHKIREKTTTEDGRPGFITYGTTTDTNDDGILTYEYIEGKYVGKFPKLGTFFEFLRSTPGYIVCILLPFLYLIITQLISFIRTFKKYKAEQLALIEAQRAEERAAIEAERAALEEERKRQEALMQELLQMRQQMQGMTGTAPTPEAPGASENTDPKDGE